MPRYDSSMTEERVVEMRIDNDNFEKGAKETISTLEKLEKALKIKGNTDAIDDMSNAVRKFDASPMVDSFDTAVNSISNKAAFLQGIFNELGRDIYNFAKNTVQGVATEPIKEGMDKYTTLAETTQTLMAATKDYYIDLGITDENDRLKELTKWLEMLQWYSDETSYSFNDMADAVAKFVAAGVPIDQASQAIIGIATASAAAGANAKAASHTMQYAWAQAFGTGYMGLGDFKTLENQNIATKEFKQNLLEIGAELGKISRVAKDGTDAYNDFYTTITDKSRFDENGYILKLSEKEEEAMFNWKNMRESLKEKWMDTDVMTVFANRYGEFAARLYDFYEAVEKAEKTTLEVSTARDLLDRYRSETEHKAEYWSEVARELGLSVNELYKHLNALDSVEWKISESGFYMGQEYKTWQDVLDATRDAVSSQWMKTFEHIFGDFIEAKELWTKVGELFYDAFVSWNVTRNNILKEWHLNGGRQALLGFENDAGEIKGALWNIVEAVQSVTEPIKEAFDEAFGLTKGHKQLGKELIELTERFRNWTTQLSFSEGAQEGIKLFWEDLFNILRLILKVISTAIVVIGRLYTSVIHPLIDTLWKGYKYIRNIGEEIKNWFTGTSVYKNIVGFLEKGKDAFDNFLNTIQNLFAPTKEFEQIILDVKAAIEGLHISEKFEKALNFIIENLAKLGIDITPAIDKIKGTFSSLKDFLSPVNKLIEEFKRRLETLKVNEALTPLQRFFYALQGTGRSALRMINKKLQELAEKFPILKDLFSMFENISFGEILKSVGEWFGDLGKKISDFYNIAKDAFKKLGIDLSSLWTRMKEGMSFNEVIEAVETAFKEFGNAFSDWFDPVKESIEEKFDGLINWFDEIKPRIKEAWDSFINFILSLFNQNAETITRSNPMLEQSGFYNAFSWLPEGVQNTLNTILNIIGGAFDAFKTALSKILDGEWAGNLFDDFLKLLRNAAFFEIGLGVANFGKGIRNLSKAFQNLTKVVKKLSKSRALKKGINSIAKTLKRFLTGKYSIGNLFKSLSYALKNGFKIKKYDSIGTTILKIAAAIGVLVGAIYVLTKLDPNKVNDALKVLGELAAGLLATAFIFKLISFDGDPILKLAISIGILIAALWVITKFPVDTFYKGLARIGLMLLELAAFSRIAGGKYEFYAPFIKLAAALWILMKPLKILAEMDIGSMIQGLVGLGTVMLEFGTTARIANTNVKTGGFIKMAIAIGILSYVASKIGEMDVDQLLQGVIGLGAVILEFRTLVKSANGMGRTSGFISMSIAVGILSYTMSKLGEMDLWSAMKGVRMLGVVINSLSKVITSAKGFTLANGLTTLLYIAGLLFELYFAFDYINKQNMDFGNILMFSTSIAEICVGFGYMIKQAKAVSFTAAGATLTEFLGFLGIFAGLLAGLTALKENIDPEQYEKIMNDVISVSNMLGRIIGELFGGFIAGFGHGIFGDALDGIGEVIDTLVDRFKEFVAGGFDLEAFGTKLSNFMTNVQGFVTGAKEIDPSIATNVGALTKAILEITGSEFLSHLLDSLANIDSMEEFSKDVPKIGQALQDFSSSFNNIEKVDDTVVDNVDTLGKAITKVSGAEFKKSIGEFLTLGQTLTDESGNKISSLDKFGTDVVKLGNALVAFAESISGMPEGSEKNIKNATIAAQGLAELNNSLPTTGGKLQEWLGWKDLGSFADDLEPLGDALKAYNRAIAGIASDKGTATETDVSTAIEMANGLVALNNALPRSGDDAGLLNFIGWKSLTNFSEDMGPLGSALFAYSASIAGISKGDKVADDADTEQAITMANGIAKLQNNLASTGGKWAEWFGDEDLSGFATGVKDIGDGLKAYAESISGISGLVSEDDSNEAIALATSLEEFIEGTSQVGGKIQEFTGRWDLANFGKEIATFAMGLKIFTTLTEDIGTENGINAITVVQPIKDFVDELDSDNGLIPNLKKLWSGDKIKTLYNQLDAMTTLATDLRTFSEDMASVDSDQVGNATKIMDAIGSFVQSIETSNAWEGFLGIFTGDRLKDRLTSLTDTADAMGNFGKQFKDFSDGIAEAAAASSNIDSAKDAFDKFNAMLGSVRTADEETDDLFLTLADMSDFGTQFATFAEGIAGAAAAVGEFGAAANVVRSFRELQNESAGNAGESILSQQDLIDAINLGSQIPEALGNGVAQNEAAYTGRIDELQAQAETVFNGAEMDFYTIGFNLDAGLAAGIYANSAAPINAVAEVCSAMVDTANSMLQVHSPSRLFMQIGDYLDQGLSKGISMGSSDPVGSIKTLGDQLIIAMQDAMAQVAAIASNEFDFQPQITPVVDASNIKSVASEYRGLFGGSIYSRMSSGISRNIAAAQNAQSAYNSMLENTPASSTGDVIQVTVNAAEGQSEEAVADAVINRISAKSTRRKFAFG